MLKCVVFTVTAYGYDVLLKEKKQIESVLKEGAIGLKVFAVQSEEAFGIRVEQSEYEQQELLFITDDRAVLRELSALGCYVIAFYHEANRHTFFEGALYAVENISRLSLESYEKAYRRLANIPWDILETERLWVRESTVEDVDAFYAIYANPKITRYLEDLFADPQEERAYMETYIKQFYGFYGFGMWTVICKKTGRIIGRAGLSVREGYELPELGFVIEVSSQQNGFAYEVCTGILQYAREELLFEQVQALAEPENTASQRLLEKLGFTFVECVKEADRFLKRYVIDNTIDKQDKEKEKDGI